MTRAELLRLADQADDACRAAVEAGDRAAALKFVAQAQLYREVADELGRLTRGKRSATLKSTVMTDAHRQAISEAHSPASGPMTAARKAGLRTMSDVASALGCTKGFISQVFSGKKPMPDDKGALFEKLTKYPAKLWKE